MFFLFELFLQARAEIKNNFVGFLVQMRTRKFAFKINRPLDTKISNYFCKSYIHHKYNGLPTILCRPDSNPCKLVHSSMQITNFQTISN